MATSGDTTMKVEIYETPHNGKIIRLLEPIRIIVKGNEYTVPVGHLSEGMSVPRLFWSIISPAIDNRTLRSACAHDWLYENHVCTRREADKWFLDSLIEDGFPRWKAWLSFIGVRAFGWRHWSQSK